MRATINKPKWYFEYENGGNIIFTNRNVRPTFHRYYGVNESTIVDHLKTLQICASTNTRQRINHFPCEIWNDISIWELSIDQNSVKEDDNIVHSSFKTDDILLSIIIIYIAFFKQTLPWKLFINNMNEMNEC